MFTYQVRTRYCMHAAASIANLDVRTWNKRVLMILLLRRRPNCQSMCLLFRSCPQLDSDRHAYVHWKEGRKETTCGRRRTSRPALARLIGLLRAARALAFPSLRPLARSSSPRPRPLFLHVRIAPFQLPSFREQQRVASDTPRGVDVRISATSEVRQSVIFFSS